MTVGGKSQVKAKEKTFDSELTLAIAAGDTGLIDSWITRLAGLCTGADYPFAPIFASNLLKFWMKAKQNLKRDELVLAYTREYRMDKVGRGFPQAYDSELSDRARSRETAPSKWPSPSASVANEAQMSELIAAMKDVAGKVGGLERGLNAVQSKVGSLETKVGQVPLGQPVPGKVCIACGSADHMYKDCTSKPDGFEPPEWYKNSMGSKKK